MSRPRFAQLQEDANVSRREAGKQERRERILAAAEDLIREEGGAAFSMRALAKRAGVAFVTPFNLFESKAGVLLGLVEKRIDVQVGRLTARERTVDPIERLFEQAVVGTGAYSADPALYQPLVRAIASADGFDHERLMSRSVELWMLALREAVEAGFVREDRDLTRLARSLHLAFRWTLWQWSFGLLDTQELEVQCQYGVAVSLLSALSDEGRAQVLERVTSIGAAEAERPRQRRTRKTARRRSTK